MSASLLAVLLWLFAGPALAAQESGKGKKEDPSKKAGEEKTKKAPPPEAKKKDGGDKPGEDDPSTASEEGKDKPAKTEKAQAQTLSIDDEYVHENLEAYLHPTKLEWLPDGRAKILFEFGEKNPDWENIFSPKVATEVNSKFRWSVRGEYGWSYTGGTSSGSGSSKSGESSDWYYGGLRMGMEGQALLNVWFTDEIDSEITYVQFVSHSAKQIFALAFTNEAGKSVGNNYGTQAATFEKGRLTKPKGTVEQVLNEHGMRFGLKVKDGNFEVARDGKVRQKMEYAKKTFGSGRLGFIWSGGVASIVHRIEVTGRIDSKKMAALLRKAKK